MEQVVVLHPRLADADEEVEQPSYDRLCALHLGIDAVLDRLPDPRHRAHDVGIHALQVVEQYLADRLGVRNRAPEVDYRILEDPLERMPHRQHRQPSLTRSYGVADVIDLCRDGVQIGLREHYTLGLPGRAAGEDHRRQLIHSSGRNAAVDLRRLRCKPCHALLDQVSLQEYLDIVVLCKAVERSQLRAIHHDNRPHDRQVLAYREDPVQHLGVLDEHYPRLRSRQDERKLSGHAVTASWHVCGAAGLDCKIGDKPVGPVVAYVADEVSPPKPQVHQGQGKRPDLGGDLRICMAYELPLAVLLHLEDAFTIACSPAEEKLRHRHFHYVFLTF